MTALEKYVRLEALGHWQETLGSGFREVVVRFGDSTLILTDLADRPLGHWALAGVQKVGMAGSATIYTMNGDANETLQIDDDDMVEAIGAVTRAHLHREVAESRPLRRNFVPPVLLLLVFAAVASAFPTVVRKQAARMAPPDALVEFGDRILLQMMAVGHSVCTDPAGGRALTELAQSIAQGRTFRVRAFDLGEAPLALLPGPTIVIGSVAVTQAEDPAEVAGWIALGLQREETIAGAERLMAAAGPLSNLRYVLTGEMNETALARVLETALAPPAPYEIDAAYDRLLRAGISPTPFAEALGRMGIGVSMNPVDGRAALSDQSWVALQGICE